MRIEEWVYNTTGLDGWWTAFQFDRAVSWFGNHVENKLMERDKDGKSIYTLEALIESDAKNQSLSQLMSLIGVIER